jgi:hypothetical protein
LPGQANNSNTTRATATSKSRSRALPPHKGTNKSATFFLPPRCSITNCRAERKLDSRSEYLDTQKRKAGRRGISNGALNTFPPFADAPPSIEMYFGLLKNLLLLDRICENCSRTRKRRKTTSQSPRLLYFSFLFFETCQPPRDPQL